MCVQTVHTKCVVIVHVQEQKEAYRQYRRTYYGDTTDVFGRKTVSQTVVQTVPVVPSTLGPTPFSTMSNSAALAMASALNHTQPVAGWRLAVIIFSTVV